MSEDVPSHPSRRKTDHSLRPRENWYRDVWLFLISGVVLWAVITSVNASHDAKNAANSAEQATARLERISSQNASAILQVCSLTEATVRDNLGRLDQSVHFISDPENLTSNKSLVHTVKTVSIPFIIRQIDVARQNYPDACGTPPSIPKHLKYLFSP